MWSRWCRVGLGEFFIVLESGLTLTSNVFNRKTQDALYFVFMRKVAEHLLDALRKLYTLQAGLPKASAACENTRIQRVGHEPGR